MWKCWQLVRRGKAILCRKLIDNGNGTYTRKSFWVKNNKDDYWLNKATYTFLPISRDEVEQLNAFDIPIDDKATIVIECYNNNYGILEEGTMDDTELQKRVKDE